MGRHSALELHGLPVISANSCRYLVAAPPRPDAKSNRLRPTWRLATDFRPRFGGPLLDRLGPIRILEFYASTEGNVWLYNVEGKIGSICRAPPYIALLDQIALARFDLETQMPARGASGFCERCADGEIGEALGRIDEDPGAQFEGYSEPAETAKKILRDVFAHGDAWMRTGDLMCRDANGFYTFVDRIGDTFRWKGENVATLEVSVGDPKNALAQGSRKQSFMAWRFPAQPTAALAWRG